MCIQTARKGRTERVQKNVPTEKIEARQEEARDQVSDKVSGQTVRM